MSSRPRLSLLAASALMGVLTVDCQNGITGPSLSATVVSVRLQPTVSGLEGGENVCCCHVIGQVVNTSSVGVDVELTFPAVKGSQSLGSAIAIEREIPSGGSRSFQAVGITSACVEVSLNQILTDERLRVKGHWQP